MKKIIWVLMLFVLLANASANVIITEVMYAPSQTVSDTDGEWIEIYNPTNGTIDLNKWTIDGYAFDDVVIGPKEYLVIAKELVDGGDVDNESFESLWGNGDGVWDGGDGFKAVDGYFSLALDDTVVLSNGTYEERLYYNSSFGGNKNGKTLERVNLSLLNTYENWAESRKINGTPGKGRDGRVSGNTLSINATIKNLKPVFKFARIITDDSLEEGVQIMPDIIGEKEIVVEIMVEDKNGVDDLVSGEVKLVNMTVKLKKHIKDNSTAIFNGTFKMSSNAYAGNHIVHFLVGDSDERVSANLSFEYLALLSSKLETSYVHFSNLNPGELSSEEIITVRNTGNVKVGYEMSGMELKSGDDSMPVESLEVKQAGKWKKISLDPLILDSNVNPNESMSVNMRLAVPENIRSGAYATTLRVISRVV